MIPPHINVHASCVVLARAGEMFGAPGDAGVLILGESGAGKSDLALRLIAMGAVLVADDRCDLFVSSDALHAGMIEIRGVGIVRLPWKADARIALAIRLDASGAITRLPEPAKYRPPPPIELPEQNLPNEFFLAPFEASAPAKVLAAAAKYARR
jgi:serine kinase of HPr protein (carbohydrate metabolism regulator)